MKVVLIRPFNKYMYSFVPPLGLGYLASILKIRGNHEVLLYEAVRDQLNSISHFEDYLLKNSPDVIGIQLYSVDLLISKEYMRCAKNINLNVVIVVGGPHPSALPEDTMHYFGNKLLDFCIAGEGELGFLDFVNNLAKGQKRWEEVAGLVWRSEDGSIKKNSKAIIEDLDQLPWPDWELLNPHAYPDAPQGGFGKGFPMAPVLVSRGCPMDCTFCGGKSIYGHGFRGRNIDSVIAEIKYLIEELGVKEIMIQDDNITYRKSMLLEFCKKIKPLHIDWNCMNGIRLNFVDDEVAEAMKEAGCYSVGVGIESGSQRILDHMNKNLTLNSIVQKIDILSKHKILVTGLFIIGYPTETKEDVLRTIAFAKKLKIDKAAFTIFLPLPGSAIFDQLRRTGKLVDFDLSNMSYYKAKRSFSPYLSIADLNTFLRKAIRSFYLRPNVMYRMLKRSGSFSNLINLISRFIKTTF